MENTKHLSLQLAEAIQTQKQLREALYSIVHALSSEQHSIKQDFLNYQSFSGYALLNRLCHQSQEALFPLIEEDKDALSLAHDLRRVWKWSWDNLRMHSKDTAHIAKITAPPQTPSFSEQEVQCEEEIRVANEVAECEVNAVPLTESKAVDTEDLSQFYWENNKERLLITSGTVDEAAANISLPQYVVNNQGTLLNGNEKMHRTTTNDKWNKLREYVSDLRFIPSVKEQIARYFKVYLHQRSMVKLAVLFSSFDSLGRGGLNLKELSGVLTAVGVHLSATKVRKFRRELGEEFGLSKNKHDYVLLSWNEFQKYIMALQLRKTERGIHFDRNTMTPRSSRKSVKENSVFTRSSRPSFRGY